MYKELVKQLRSTVSRSKRTLFDDAADAIEQLQKELCEERYRHDRLQDFEVAEAEQLHQMRIARSMLSKKLREKESVLSLLRQGKQQWISVKDRLPGESGYYLYFADNPYKGLQDGIGVSYFMHKAKEWKKVYTPCVTHWMPLPEPPEEGSHDL